MALTIRHIGNFSNDGAYREASDGWPGRVAVGRVIVPTDSAPAARVARYEAYAAGRYERTLKPQGDKRILFPRDLVGSAEQIVEWLQTDPVLPLIDELRLELPYEFTLPEYEQILTDTIERIAPALGWSASTQKPERRMARA